MTILLDGRFSVVPGLLSYADFSSLATVDGEIKEVVVDNRLALTYVSKDAQNTRI